MRNSWLGRSTAALCVVLLSAACGREIETDPGAVVQAGLALSAESTTAAAAENLAGGLGENRPADASYVRQAAASGPLPDGPRPAAAPGSGPLAVRTVLYSENDAELRVRMDGYVRAVSADLGDRVAAGQLLARLEDGEEEAAAASARAALELAQTQHRRADQLRAKDLITQQELEEASYRLRAAEAALGEAVARLERTRIRAPFAGRVTRRFVRVGQGVLEGDPLFRVTAADRLRAQVRIPEADANRIRPGQRVSVSGVDGAQVAGRVSGIAPAVDPASGTVELVVEVPSSGQLRPGSAVTVLLPSLSGAR